MCVPMLSLVVLYLFQALGVDSAQRGSAYPHQQFQSVSSKQLKILYDRKEMEMPNRSSPRTGFSSKRFDQLQVWMAFQQKLKYKISGVGNVNILFYGDSITESLEGTSYGNDCTTKRCRGIPEIFQSTLQKHNLTSHVSAIAGDRTQHLLWRLTEGEELPATIHPDVVVVLIGTNNIAPNTVESIALGIQDTIDVIHKKLPHTTILVNEIFPRYDEMVVKINKTKSVEKLNVLLRDFFVDHKSTNLRRDGISASDAIQYLQCGSLFDPTPEQHADNGAILVNVDLLPDKLHPNAAGMEKWLTECVLPPALAAMTMK